MAMQCFHISVVQQNNTCNIKFAKPGQTNIEGQHKVNNSSFYFYQQICM